jgi:hypothetical protein
MLGKPFTFHLSLFTPASASRKITGALALTKSSHRVKAGDGTAAGAGHRSFDIAAGQDG